MNYSLINRENRGDIESRGENVSGNWFKIKIPLFMNISIKQPRVKIHRNSIEIASIKIRNLRFCSTDRNEYFRATLIKQARDYRR